ncbi:MAG: DNA polymerase III subunit gamma/tau [Patescibacteria group bacterium]|jgi:DNA polymerase-3 subunit gamma/tau
MSSTLYRKYRPQKFKELVGQNHIRTTIQSELENGKVAHAYLFSGPRGLGKTTTARLLAKAVNCLKRKEGESEPCDSCDSCLELIANKSLDVIEIDAASHTGVDNVRENIINNSRFTPTSRKFKVFIIDEVHMLSTAAFNALLKTLEEPPSHVIFVLATTEIHKVPQTIISRCQHFDFHKVPEKDIIQRLAQLVSKEGKKVDQAILENIAYHSEGCIRDAESLLGQVLSLGEKEITLEQAELVLPHSHFDLVLELIDYLIKSDSISAIALINRLVENGIDLERFTNDLIEVLRKILLVKVSTKLNEFTASFSKDLEKRIVDTAEKISLELLVKVIEIFVAKRYEIKFADIPQLPLELAVLEIITSHQDSNDSPKNKNDDSNFSGGLNQGENKKAEVPIINPLPKPRPEKNLSKVKLSLEQIKEKWEEVLICLKKYNQSLASTLRIGRPSTVKEDGTLELCFKHKFHQQRVNDLKNKQTLEKVLEEIFGVKLIVKTVIVKDLADDKVEVEALAESPTDESLKNVLETFGGQIVN